MIKMTYFPASSITTITAITAATTTTTTSSSSSSSSSRAILINVILTDILQLFSSNYHYTSEMFPVAHNYQQNK